MKLDLLAAVVGRKVNPEELGPEEWFEIIMQAVDVLTFQYLRRFGSIEYFIVNGNRPRGSSLCVEKEVLEAGLPENVSSNTGFLMVVDLALRPGQLPGKAEHILLSRKKEFYRLTIHWVQGKELEKVPYYNASKIALTQQHLLSLLKEGHGSKLPKKILSALEWVQWDTERDLHAKLSEATRAHERLNQFCQRLGISIANVLKLRSPD